MIPRAAIAVPHLSEPLPKSNFKTEGVIARRELPRRRLLILGNERDAIGNAILDSQNLVWVRSDVG